MQTVDAAAHEAATSDLNLLRKPSDTEARAGAYRMGHFKIGPLDITIENPAGSSRHPDWPPLQDHYGYIKGTIGADGDHVDCFVKPGTPLDWHGDVYVVDQSSAAGVFDEHKCMLGYDDRAQATKAYLSNFTPGWVLGRVTTFSFEAFDDWLRQGNTTAPVAKTSLARLLRLHKEFTAPTSATSGIAGYGSSSRKRRKPRPLMYAKNAP